MVEDHRYYTKPFDFKLNIELPVSDSSGGVIETTGSKTTPDLSLPAGTPAGVSVKATPFTSGDGRTYLRLALNQPFGLGFPFDTFFRAGSATNTRSTSGSTKRRWADTLSRRAR